MARVNVQKNKLRFNANEDDFIETSREMVKKFSGDQSYKEDYVLVSGIKVVAEGCVEEVLKQAEKPLAHRM